MEPNRQVYESYVQNAFGRGHDFSAREYALHSRYFRRNYSPFLPKQRDASVRDIACGGGHFLQFLLTEGYTNFSGIDISPECIEICRRIGVRVEQADAFEYLSRKQGRFDAIVCNDFLEHLPKDRAFEFVRLCRSALDEGNGVLIMKVPNAACPLVGCRTRYIDITHEMSYTDHSLRTLLVTCGFRDVTIVGPDIYVTRNPLANCLGRMLFCAATATFRVLYYLYGVKTRHVMTKNLLAVART